MSAASSLGNGIREFIPFISSDLTLTKCGVQAQLARCLTHPIIPVDLQRCVAYCSFFARYNDSRQLYLYALNALYARSISYMLRQGSTDVWNLRIT
jgi:hypothetical protein